MDASLNFEGAIAWIGAIMLVMSFVGTIWGYVSSPAKTVGKRVDDLIGRVDRHDLKIASLEHGQQSLPTTGEMHQLEVAMAELRGEMKTMSAVIGGQADIMMRVETMVARHEQHLLDGKK
jgi:hypothetical protein